MFRLKIDIKSHFGNKIYGYAGDLVTLVKEYGNVSIVENSEGNRFPVKVEFLTSEEVEIKPKAVPDTTAPTIVKRSAVSKTLPILNKQQTSLF